MNIIPLPYENIIFNGTNKLTEASTVDEAITMKLHWAK